MPRLSYWSLRIAMVYLVTGLTFGMLLLIHKGIPLHPALWLLLPAHIECLLIGWTLQFALGIAYWILPRFGSSRGNVHLAVLAFWLLNTGVLLAVSGYWFGGQWGLTEWGRMLEASAVVIFAVHAWPRIKPLGA